LGQSGFSIGKLKETEGRKEAYMRIGWRGDYPPP